MTAPDPSLPCHLTVMEQLGRGGAERALIVLLPELQRLGLRCEVAAAAPPYDLAPELEALGIPVQRWNIPYKNVVRGTRELLRAIRERNAVFVQTHSVYPALYSALSARFAPRPKRIMSFHNLGYSSYPAVSLRQKVLKAATRSAMKRMDALVAPSQAVADHYRDHLGLEGVQVIPHLLDPEALAAPAVDRRAVLSKVGLAPEGFTIGMVGRFVHEKGHRFLLDALSVLRERDQHPKAILLGNGPLFDQIQRSVGALGLSSQVKLVPALSHAEALAVMQACDLIAIPSTHEGFSLVAMEAMLLGKPVVASATGGLNELVRQDVSGVSVPSGDAAALAGAIARLSTDKQYAETLASAGRRFIFDLCSPENVMPRWETALLRPQMGGREGQER